MSDKPARPVRMLGPPPTGFAAIELPVVKLEATELLRISAYGTGEPHFGRTGQNRFDAPDGSFGVCYCGRSLACAFAESILHERDPVDGGFPIPGPELRRHFAWTFGTGNLVLADLTGPSLKRLGADGQLSTMEPYDVPQLWAAAVHAHPAQVDGIRYVSRHCNTEFAVAVFDRAKGKLTFRERVRLPANPSFRTVIRAFNVHVGYADAR